MQLLRKLLFPISLIYALVVFLRNRFYDMGIFSSMSFKTTTICIGNLSVGGTGKTPMTELLIRSLMPHFKIAVLSRGYKRKSSGFVLATEKATVTEIGDEPFQLSAKFPEVTVAVDSDRRNGIQKLEKEIKPDLILLDDAFQHRKVSPDFSILLTTYDNLYVDDWYLPTGNLRDVKYAAKRADLIVVTKCSPNLGKEEKLAIKKKINPKDYQKVLFAFLTYSAELKGLYEIVELAYFQDKKVTLVTGIANPEPLVSYLRKNGIAFNHLAFRDHHFFTRNELELLRTKECIITTEKDYSRLNKELDNLFYISVEHCFLSDGQDILDKQLNLLMNP